MLAAPGLLPALDAVGIRTRELILANRFGQTVWSELRGTAFAIRRAFFKEGPPAWTGIMLWRGAVEWPVFGDGRTMLIAGGMRAKFVLYPIVADPARHAPHHWVVASRVSDGSGPPPRREEWNRPGKLAELLPLI